jgi:hypothetical protein
MAFQYEIQTTLVCLFIGFSIPFQGISRVAAAYLEIKKNIIYMNVQRWNKYAGFTGKAPTGTKE